jgi:hypothetical protein
MQGIALGSSCVGPTPIVLVTRAMIPQKEIMTNKPIRPLMFFILAHFLISSSVERVY